jgi:hypothetical protein
MREVTPCEARPEWFDENLDYLWQPDQDEGVRYPHAEKAIRACALCPLKKTCYEQALNRGEPQGIWGGRIIGY